jgi:dTDP-4-amino-4,6-dideoxygalactose transaminase
MGGVAGPSWFDTSRTAIKLGAYALLLRPSLYSLVRRLPLGLGLTPYETNYPIVRFNRGLAGFALRQLEHLAEINGVRVMNAGRIRRYATSIDALEIPVTVHGAEAVYARFSVLVDPTMRTSLIRALEREGIGATASYPRALIDVPEVARHLPRDQSATPGARRVAERIITLPTHGYVPPDIGERIAAVIRTVADS